VKLEEKCGPNKRFSHSTLILSAIGQTPCGEAGGRLGQRRGIPAGLRQRRRIPAEFVSKR